MTTHIERLIHQLDDSTGPSYDARVEPVRRAYRTCLERATPPDWSEPEGIRWALTELGARAPVVPPLTTRLRATTADDAPGWPSSHFTESSPHLRIPAR